MTTSAQLWTGRILTGFAALFLTFDGVIKLLRMEPVREAFTQLQIPFDLAPGIGILELACLAIYLVPQTTVLGATLLTGYLGGAILAHLRIGDPFFSHTIFPVYVGLMLWGGLYLRNERLRALIPITQKGAN